MKRFLASIGVAATALIFAAAPVSAASNNNSWHRLNADKSNPAPEHERLTCARGTDALLCQYDKVRATGYQWDRSVARFKGHDVTAGWSCPPAFGSDVCDNVDRVWSGQARYWPAQGGSFKVAQEMIIVNWGGQKVMFQYWVNQFACPWFRSFSEARAANPSHDFDCVLP